MPKKKIDSLLKEYYDSHRRQYVGFGMYIYETYGVGDWVELAHMSAVTAIVNVNQYLNDYGGRLDRR